MRAGVAAARGLPAHGIVEGVVGRLLVIREGGREPGEDTDHGDRRHESPTHRAPDRRGDTYVHGGSPCDYGACGGAPVIDHVVRMRLIWTRPGVFSCFRLLRGRRACGIARPAWNAGRAQMCNAASPTWRVHARVSAAADRIVRSYEGAPWNQETKDSR